MHTPNPTNCWCCETCDDVWPSQRIPGWGFFGMGLLAGGVALANYGTLDGPRWLVLVVPAVFVVAGLWLLLIRRRVVIDAGQDTILIQHRLAGVPLRTKTYRLSDAQAVALQTETYFEEGWKDHYAVTLGKADVYRTRAYFAAKDRAVFLAGHLNLPIRNHVHPDDTSA